MESFKKGFTLIEAILVIVIMGIVAMVVLPRFFQGNFLKNLELRTEVHQVGSDIRLTRQLALTNSAHYLIKFDFSNNKYAIYKETAQPENLVGEIKEISSKITCSGTNQFDFYSIGNAVFSGRGLFLALESARYQIIVEPPSGVVVVEKYPSAQIITHERLKDSRR